MSNRLPLSRPLVYLLALCLIIPLGLASRDYAIGVYFWDKSLGDVLWAMMFYLLLAIALPHRGLFTLGLMAFGICIGIELFKLTGFPARWSASWLSRLIFGVAFAWHNVICHAAGVAGIATLDAMYRRIIQRTDLLLRPPV